MELNDVKECLKKSGLKVDGKCLEKIDKALKERDWKSYLAALICLGPKLWKFGKFAKCLTKAVPRKKPGETEVAFRGKVVGACYPDYPSTRGALIEIKRGRRTRKVVVYWYTPGLVSYPPVPGDRITVLYEASWDKQPVISSIKGAVHRPDGERPASIGSCENGRYLLAIGEYVDVEVAAEEIDIPDDEMDALFEDDKLLESWGSLATDEVQADL